MSPKHTAILGYVLYDPEMDTWYSMRPRPMSSGYPLMMDDPHLAQLFQTKSAAVRFRQGYPVSSIGKRLRVLEVHAYALEGKD